MPGFLLDQGHQGLGQRMPIPFRAPLPGCHPLRGAALLAALLLGACASMPAVPGMGAAEPAGPAPIAAPAPVATTSTDALAGFVAGARPGAVAEVAGYGPVRLARAYTAASGRECREVMLGRGMEERAAVYCRNGQGWAPARPLLRSGTTRP